MRTSVPNRRPLGGRLSGVGGREDLGGGVMTQYRADDYWQQLSDGDRDVTFMDANSDVLNEPAEWEDGDG